MHARRGRKRKKKKGSHRSKIGLRRLGKAEIGTAKLHVYSASFGVLECLREEESAKKRKEAIESKIGFEGGLVKSHMAQTRLIHYEQCLFGIF